MEVSIRHSAVSDRGQSTLEWTGLLLLVSLLMVTLATTLGGVSGLALVHSVSTRMLCAASLSDSCDRRVELDSAYGSELADEVRAAAPVLFYGPDMLGLPVDYRTCRSPWCADGPGSGPVTESTAGEPVTLFTRVLDCRGGGPRPASVADCADGGEGAIFIQFWAYYPESASLRGAPLLEEQGYHANDWESFQVRINADGSVDQRASSHAGYNHSRSAANWGSDLGWGLLRDLAEKSGLRNRGGWGEASGDYLIAGGSHAGNVRDGSRDRDDYPGFTPASAVRLLPLERIRRQGMSKAARFDPITPPWKKLVWKDPEAEGTG